MTKARSTILAITALAFVAMMLLPVAAAQAPVPTINVKNPSVPSSPIKPQIDSPTIKVDFTYSVINPVLGTSAQATGPVIVKVIPQCQNGVQLTGPQAVIVSLAAGQQSAEGSASFTVSVPRTAPGLQAVTCTVKVSSDAAGPAFPAVGEQPISFILTPDFYSLSQVKVATKLKQSGPQKQVPFEMEITNFGNARTQYLFELGAQPGGKWNAILPEVLLLDSPVSGQGSPTNTAILTVATPFKNGWNNLEGAYQIIITPSAADDSSKTGNPLTANMLVRVRGVYVPSLEPMVMLGAVLGSALLLRMKKDEE